MLLLFDISCCNGMAQHKPYVLAVHRVPGTGEVHCDKPVTLYDFALYWYHSAVETTCKLRTINRTVQYKFF
jgi:hypothetical protein